MRPHVINNYSLVCICNQHVFLVKAKASKFSEQCSFIISSATTSQDTSEVSKANLLSRALLVRGSSQKGFREKTGPASQEAGPYKGMTQTECVIIGPGYILNSMGTFSGVANHPIQGKLFPVQNHLSQRE